MTLGAGPLGDRAPRGNPGLLTAPAGPRGLVIDAWPDQGLPFSPSSAMALRMAAGMPSSLRRVRLRTFS